MSDLPYMPLYVSDYIGDTAHLTTLEHGAYLMLLFTYWMRQKPLPDDRVKLSRIAKVTPDEWAAMETTLAEFFQVGDGVWSHKRVEAELERAKAKLEKASNAGRASAEARKGKRSSDAEHTSNERSTPVEQPSNHKVRLGKDTTLETSSSERDTRAREPFDEFWDVWPHKVNLKVAEAAFDRIKGVDIADILAGVARYVASRSPDQQWPDPAKWLDGRRWEDQPAARLAASPPRAAVSLDEKRSVPGKVYVMGDSPQGQAWDASRRRATGRGQVWDGQGGWFFPTEWPPDHAKAGRIREDA